MVVISKDELPSYFGVPLADTKDESPPPAIATTSSAASYYAPAPAAYSAAPTASNSDTTTPPCFSRARTQGPGVTYSPFKPMFLLSSSNRSTSLSKGFPMAAPPAKEEPHPFVTHDINEIDWLQFLNDVRVAGSLTEKDVQRSYLPIVSWLPFIGSLSVYGVQKYMKSRKSSAVAKTLDIWNRHFFEPRKMRIVLMRGYERLSGLQESMIGELPEPVNVSSGIMDHAVGSGGDTKGKGRSKGEDEAYRLFVLSI